MEEVSESAKTYSRNQQIDRRTTTKHPGSKRPKNKKHRRATAKRAKQSRRINR